MYAAPLDVKRGEDTVYQPDLLVVLREHADRLRETHIEGAPDWVVEVVSPSTAYLDLLEKRYDYGRAGVREYWVVDPETRMVEVYGLGGAADASGGSPWDGMGAQPSDPRLGGGRRRALPGSMIEDTLGGRRRFRR